MTFIFYLCPACAETHGHVAGLMAMPDEVFFATLAEEQVERYGHYLTPEEWARLDGSHPLVKMIENHYKGH
jgi:hypothetical protein